MPGVKYAPKQQHVCSPAHEKMKNQSPFCLRHLNFALSRGFKSILCCIPAVFFSACFFLPDYMVANPMDQKIELALQPVRSSGKVLHPVRHPEAGEQSDESRRRKGISDELALSRFVTFPAHDGAVNSLVVSKDGLHAFSGGQDGSVVYSTIIRSRTARSDSTARFTVESRVLMTGDKPVLAIALSHDEQKIAVAQFSSVAIYDRQSGMIERRLTRVKGRILSLAWDPRDELLAFGRANGEVFIWNIKRGAGAGRDNIDALETYSVGGSPIVSLTFHPSGRAFIAATRNGALIFWQLLRTASELGLRDPNAKTDEENVGRTRAGFGSVPSGIGDIWLTSDARGLFVAARDGTVYRWKIRGLRRKEPIVVGSDSVFSLRGLEVPSFGNSYKPYELLVTSGRGQRLKFWCQEPGDSELLEARTAGISQVLVVDESGLPVNPPPGVLPSAQSPERAAELAAERERLQSEEIPDWFIGQTKLFRNPLTLLRGGERAPLLWAAEKTGNLLAFDADTLLKQRSWHERARFCKPF